MGISISIKAELYWLEITSKTRILNQGESENSIGSSYGQHIKMFNMTKLSFPDFNTSKYSSLKKLIP